MSDNSNAVNNNSLDKRIKLYLSIMTHNGMPDLAVKNWAAVAVDMGTSVATVKQRFGKDKELFRIAMQDGPPPAAPMKRRNRGKKQDATAVDDDSDDDDVEGNTVNAPAAPAAPFSKTRKRASNRNDVAAAADNDGDKDQEIEDDDEIGPASLATQTALAHPIGPIGPVGPAGASGASVRTTGNSNGVKKQNVISDDHDGQAGEDSVAGPSARATRAARTAASPTPALGPAPAPRFTQASHGSGSTVAGRAALVVMTRKRGNTQRFLNDNENEVQAEDDIDNAPAGPTGIALPRHWQHSNALGINKDNLRGEEGPSAKKAKTSSIFNNHTHEEVRQIFDREAAEDQARQGPMSED